MGHLETETTDHFKGISASHIKGQNRVEITRINHRSHIHSLENVILTPKEQTRLQVLNSLLAEHMTLEQAAKLMELSPRHTRRILVDYRENGAASLAHGHRGRRPANAIPESTKGRVVHLVARAVARWATGAEEWWTTSMVAVGGAGRVEDRIRGCEPTGW